jgi:hypothetical protein
MDELKRTSEYRKLLPFIAKASGDVGHDTTGEEVAAVVSALNTHKSSTDHDSRYSLVAHLHDDRYYTETESNNRYSLLSHLHDDRYYTETETDNLLSAKASKLVTMTAGNGLTGGGTLEANRTFTVGAGLGITVNADDVALASSTAGAGLTYTSGVLAVGAGLGITVNADDVALASSVAGAGLTYTSGVLDVGAGLGISVTADTVKVNMAANFNWSGSHTFGGALYTGTILPILSDVYDLGMFNKLWRKIWGSELSAIIFAQYEQTLMGGWFTVSKSQGKLLSAVAASDTQVDFGSGTFQFTPFTIGTSTIGGTDALGGDFDMKEGDTIVFRGLSPTGAPQMEYMKLGAWISSAKYNVTRNLDGTGANDWPDGSVFGNWGQLGNGRIEMSAMESPRLSVYSHGNTLAAYNEQIRIGDLNGNWGYNSAVYGAAFGEYTVGKPNLLIEPGVLRLRNYDQDVIKLTGTEASFENVIMLRSTTSALSIGSTPPTSANAGTGIWLDRTGLYGLAANSLMTKIDAVTGALTATSANITGAITATSGSFTGAITASSGAITGLLKLNGASSAISIGSNYPDDAGPYTGVIINRTGLFGLVADVIKTQIDATTGMLSATGASISGAITATSGSFTGAITASSGAITGKLNMSGASSAIAIGSTPPTSASAGTGIWIDRSGIYGLAANVLQVKFDAVTGKLYAGGGLTVLSADGVIVSGREILTAARTYYVATTGNNANSGLAVGEPFLTIQKAIDVIADTLDIRGYAITIQIADGTYTQATNIKLRSALGSGNINISGNQVTPANVVIQTTVAATSTIGANGITSVYNLSGFKLVSTSSGLNISNKSRITITNLDFGVCTGAHILALLGGVVEILGNYTITGSATKHYWAVEQADIFSKVPAAEVMTVTISGTPAFTNFADAAILSIIYTPYFTFSGAATGRRYLSGTNAFIGTNSAGANYFPGNVAGTTATGGLYD